MMGHKLTASLVALGCLTAVATPAKACKLFGCGRPATTTFYTPYVASYAPVAPACPTQQVVNYMPQTAYRTVMVNRPVVSYMPTQACDACGRSTTVMRPVTSYVAQQQLVPYTTYRPVVTSVAQPCCATVPTTVSYAPAPAAPACCGATPTPTLSSYSPAPVAAPAPSCCGSTSTPTPSLSSYSPAPTSTTIVQPSTTTTTVPSGSPGSTLKALEPTPDPNLNGGSFPSSTPSTTTTPQNQTFAPDGESSSTRLMTPQSRVLLPPYNNGTSPASTPSSNRPTGLDPESGDRMTSIPVRSSLTVRQASLVVPTRSTVKPADDSGWEAVVD